MRKYVWLMMYILFVYSCGGNNLSLKENTVYPKEKIEIYLPKNIEIMYEFVNNEYKKMQIVSENNETQVEVLENGKIIYRGTANLEVKINKGLIQIKVRSSTDNKVNILLL